VGASPPSAKATIALYHPPKVPNKQEKQ